MNSAAKLFCDYLDQKGIPYSKIKSNEIEIGWKGEYCPLVMVYLFFSDEGKDVSIRSYDIAKISAYNSFVALVTCASLNKDYRWVKFYPDDNDKVNVEIDAVITPHTTGEVCYKLLEHMLSTIDNTYTIIRRMFTN